MSRPAYPYNCHMHTNFDDGASSAEEMVRAAIDAGMVCAGFSGHSVLPFENDWSMTPESEIAYRQEIARLKEKYADRLHISCGLEWDLDSPLPEEPYDFYIAMTQVNSLVSDARSYRASGRSGRTQGTKAPSSVKRTS